MNDARKMSRKELLAKRQQVIHLYFESMPIMKIVETTGLSWPAVNTAIIKFREGGGEALTPSKRGRKLGADRVLSEEQELVIRKLMYYSRPNLLKPMIKRGASNLYLWDRCAVAELIYIKCEVSLSKRCVGNYLERWGFPLVQRNQRPIERCSPYIQKKLKGGMLEHAIKDNVPLLWVSVKKLSFTYDRVNSMDMKYQRQLSLVIAFDNRGKERWLCYKGIFSDDQQIDFLETLHKQFRSRIIVIRDNNKYFKENPVKSWLQEHKDKLEILPPPPPATKG